MNRILVFGLFLSRAYANVIFHQIESIAIENNAQYPPPPPPVDEIAKYARYVVHYSDWTTLSHISHQPNITGLPLGRVFSMTDGPIGYSSGIPYIYVSLFDPVPRDLKIDNKCSMTMSLAQTNFCSKRDLDAEDPRCPQVMLLGNFIFIERDVPEWKFAQKSMFSRHPGMKSWPKSHNFLFGKLNITSIILVDNIGGSKHPSVQDYFNTPPPIVKTQKKVYLVESI